MDVKPNFTVESEAAISAPPKVDFGKAPAGAAPSSPAAPAPSAPGATQKSGAPAGGDAAGDLLKKGY